MPRSLEELEREIRALPAADRRRLIRAVIADIDGGIDPDVEQAWLEEAEARYREIEAGHIEPVPADEVFERARARLNRP